MKLIKAPLLKSREVARILQVSPKTVTRYANEGRIPYLLLNFGERKEYRFVIEDVFKVKESLNE